MSSEVTAGHHSDCDSASSISPRDDVHRQATCTPAMLQQSGVMMSEIDDDDTPQRDSQQLPIDRTTKLVPARVLDEANATITLLMEEIAMLRDELEAVLMERAIAASTKTNAQNGSPSMGDGEVHDEDEEVEQDRNNGGAVRLKLTDVSMILATPNHDEQNAHSTEMEVHPLQKPPSSAVTTADDTLLGRFETLKRTLQSRNRSIQQLQRQLAQSKATEAALQVELGNKAAEVERHKKRDQTILHQVESLKREVMQRDGQLEKLRQSQADMLQVMEARLLAWQAQERTLCV